MTNLILDVDYNNNPEDGRRDGESRDEHAIQRWRHHHIDEGKYIRDFDRVARHNDDQDAGA
jgi:hypothetical protein